MDSGEKIRFLSTLPSKRLLPSPAASVATPVELVIFLVCPT
jgi:hypothetical protein